MFALARPVLNTAARRYISSTGVVAAAQIDVVQKLYIEELKKANEEQKKKPNPEEEILAQILAKRQTKQAKAAEAEAQLKKNLLEVEKEYAAVEAQLKQPIKVTVNAAEDTREDGRRIYLLKLFGFPESADLTVVAPAFLKKLGENALAASIKELRSDVENRIQQGQWTYVPSVPNIRKLAEQLSKIGIPVGADLFVATRLTKLDANNDEIALIANDLIREDIREVERKRMIDRIMVLVVLELPEEEQELLKLVGAKTEGALDGAQAQRQAELERSNLLYEAKKKLFLAKIGFPTDEDLASAASKIAKKEA